MALIQASSSGTNTKDPTAELRTAIRDFETALADDQRTLFRANVSKPDAESVTLFVANVAAKNQGSHGRFLWKRLCPFLEATRQFTGIVNTFVSANPAIAALVWGGIRTTILAASNATTYFDQVTSLLMEVGRLNPTYTDFGQLYIGHDGLQFALCKYYTIVIRLCTKIVQNSQRTTISHLYSTLFSPFESEFKSILDDLTTIKETIRDQISLAAKQAAAETNRLIEVESRENEKHRHFAAVFRSDVKKEHDTMEQWRNKHLQRSNAKARDRIMMNLSQINYIKAWRQALQPRVQGTAEWFEVTEDFIKWRSCPSPAIMWCRGTMGVGKTVFVSNIVSYLIEQRVPNEIVSFHFCRSDDAASLLARNIIGTLARQIIEACIQNMEHDGLNRLKNKSESPETADILDLILAYLEKDKTYYIVIDGLDECAPGDVSEIQESIAKLLGKHLGTLKILYSGRPDLEGALHPPQQNVYRLHLTPHNVQGDIDRYIDLTLDACLEDGKLKLNDPTIVLNIAKTLKQGSQGMFLWVRFFIGELCTCLSDSEILEALDRLPQELSELLNTILSRIKSNRRSNHSLNTLKYCGVSRRPLTVDELQEALGVSEGQKSLERHNMPTDWLGVISACRGLVYVDDVDETVHYVHHSLKTHLFGGVDGEPSEFDEALSDLELGKICLTYLNFSDFQRQLTRVYEGSTTPLDLIQMAVISTAPSSKIGNLVARKLLRSQSYSRTQNLQKVQNLAQDVIGNTASERLQQELSNRKFYFLSYAGAHWLDHTKMLQMNVDSHMHNQFLRTLSSGNSFVSKPWYKSNKDYSAIITDRGSAKFHPEVMRWAVENKHFTLIELIITSSRQSIPVTDEMQQQLCKSFEWCVNHSGYNDVGRFLLQFVPEAKIIERKLFWIALNGANDELAHQLLSTCCAVLETGLAFKALDLAIVSGLLMTLRTLLSSGVDTTATEKGYLVWAALKSPNDIAVMDLLLNHGADANLQLPHQTPLISATTQNNLEMMGFLIRRGADANRRNTMMETPLITAIWRRNIEAVRMLLDAGAEPGTSVHGEIPLVTACHYGSLEIADLLLAAGASALENDDGGFPLEGAMRSGNQALARRIFEASVLVRPEFRSSLEEAVENGDRRLVRKTLRTLTFDEIEPVTPQDEMPRNGDQVGVYQPLAEHVTSPRTPMQRRLKMACCGGELDVVDKLLKAGTSAVSADGSYNCLIDAVSSRHLKVVDRLIMEGIDIDSKGRYKSGYVSALELAVRLGEHEIVSSLQARGARVDFDSRSKDFLKAVRRGEVEKVRCYVNSGIDLAHFKGSPEWEILKNKNHKDFATIRQLLEDASLPSETRCVRAKDSSAQSNPPFADKEKKEDPVDQEALET